MYLPVAGGFLNGGELPGLQENGGKQGQNRGNFAGHGVQTVGLCAQKIGDHVPVRHAGDPPEDGSGNQGDAVAQHGFPQGLFRIGRTDRPELLVQHQIQCAQPIRSHHRHHIAQNSQLEEQQEENIEEDDQGSIEDALQGEQTGFSLGPDILGAQAVQIRGQGIGADQHRIFLERAAVG